MLLTAAAVGDVQRPRARLRRRRGSEPMVHAEPAPPTVAAPVEPGP